MLSYFGKRSGNFSEAKHLESMARRWMTTKRTWSQILKTSQRDFTAKAIVLSPVCVATYRKAMASRAGKFKLKRKTSTKKLRMKFQALKDWFRSKLTAPTAAVWQTLQAKLTGHYQYYNINDNWRWVMKYREAARRMGMRWLRRRSQNSQVTWESYNNYQRAHPLPNPDRIVDLIALARRICDNAKRSSQLQWLF